MENMSDYLDDGTVKQIVSVYAGKGYDAKRIREYLAKETSEIAFRTEISKQNVTIQIKTANGKTRYVVERFFAWLKCGFHRITIRYERIAENYLALFNIVSIMMYWRVLGLVDDICYNPANDMYNGSSCILLHNSKILQFFVLWLNSRKCNSEIRTTITE